MARSTRLRVAVGVAALFAALAAVGQADAQELSRVPPGQFADSGLRTGIGARRPYWSAGDPRPFFAAVFDFGGISGRVEADLGYGKPHYAWAGLETGASLSLRGVTEYAGMKTSLPFGFIRLAGRFFEATSQKLIVPRPVITRAMLDVSDGPRSSYGAIDGEVSFDIPLPVGAIGVLASAHGIFPTQDNFYVFEESLRVVTEAPFLWRGRLSYLAGIGDPPTLRVGGVAEFVHDPSRDAVTLRTGPAVAVSLTHHLEAVGVAAFTFFGPDEIGLAGADLGQISLRYRWATGDLWPDFP
jgi:hypothetical protein